MRARADLTMNAQIERAHCLPWGLHGGLDAKGNEVALRTDGAWKTDFPNAKILTAQIKAGDAVEVIHRPDHDITIGLVFRALTLEHELLPSLLSAGDDLTPEVRRRAEKLEPFNIA